MTRPGLALLVALALTAPTLAAQPPRVPVPVGARARVAVPAQTGWTIGTVAASDSAVIVLHAGRDVVPDTFLVAQVQALEVSRGRRRFLWGGVGLLIGAVVGGGVGAIVGSGGDGPDAEYAAAIAGTAGAAAGAVLGATLGALRAPERWEAVWLGRR